MDFVQKKIVVYQPKRVSKNTEERGCLLDDENNTSPVFTLPDGLPTGLTYLVTLSEIKISKLFIKHPHQAHTRVQMGNTYNICNAKDKPFMYAVEETKMYFGISCGYCRPFAMQIIDKENDQVCLQLFRPFALACCQEMEIHSPPGSKIGYVKSMSNCTCFKSIYRVFDRTGNLIFTIVGECSCFKCCVNNVFKIFAGDYTTSQPIGEITKHWQGFKEWSRKVNLLSLSFPIKTDLIKKSILLGAVFLVDYNHFER